MMMTPEEQQYNCIIDASMPLKPSFEIEITRIPGDVEERAHLAVHLSTASPTFLFDQLSFLVGENVR